jgi:hypothetical protein
MRNYSSLDQQKSGPRRNHFAPLSYARKTMNLFLNNYCWVGHLYRFKAGYGPPQNNDFTKLSKLIYGPIV